MQFDAFDRILKFLELMAQPAGATKQEVCDMLGISVRSFYRYLEFFTNVGFKVVRLKNRYSFDANSPYFRKLTAYNFFSQEELDAVLALMETSSQSDSKVKLLYQKLIRQKKWHVRNPYVVDKAYDDKVELLAEAIRDKKIVILHDYSSVKSSTVTDRIVEPYLFMGDNDSVRCYEHISGMNKMFRLSRIGSIELMPVNWIYENRHTQFYTDAFNFSGDTLYPVEVRLNFRAVRLLKEEYPGCSQYLFRLSENEWELKMNVCDFKGIGRFCLGLFRDVTPLGGQEFLDYLNKEVRDLYWQQGAIAPGKRS